MKLLLDQNLSRHLAARLAHLFPGTRHVAELRMERSDDELVWEHAKDEGFVIVSKDVDFYQRSVLRGFPPKVVWLCLGNCSTATVLAALLDASDDLKRFVADPDQSVMVVRHDDPRG